jgi:hypothetical protein
MREPAARPKKCDSIRERGRNTYSKFYATQSHPSGAFAVLCARRNEYPAGDAGGLAHRDIGGAIAGGRGTRKIKLHPLCRRDDHARIGLALICNIERRIAVEMVRAGKDRIKPRAGLRKRARDAACTAAKALQS